MKTKKESSSLTPQSLHYATFIALIISNITTLTLAALLSNSLLGGGLGYFASLREQAVSHQARAASQYYVATTGDDKGNGSIDRPWKTITYAVGKLKPGDTLNIRGGVYYERPSISVDGAEGAPISIQAYGSEAVTIDSGTADFAKIGSTEWEPVDTGIGLYRSKKVYAGGLPYAYLTNVAGYENERVALVPYVSLGDISSRSQAYSTTCCSYVGPGVYRNAEGRIYIRLAKTDEMRDVVEPRYGQIFKTAVPHPSGSSIALSTASYTFAINANHISVKNITFNQAAQTIRLGAGKHHILLDGVTAWMGDRTINFGGGNSAVTIRRSRLYGDVPKWISWTDAKLGYAPADKMRGTSVNLTNGSHDVVIEYSHLRGGHDGVGMNLNDYNLIVHHSRIENFSDDCFELEGTSAGTVGRVEIYENYIGNCQVAIAPGQDTGDFQGPLLVYRNVIALLRNPFINRAPAQVSWVKSKYGIEYMFKHGTSDYYTTKNTHYYHNTMVLLGTYAERGMNITPKYPENTRIANNIMMTVNGVVNGTYRTGAGQVLNGNLYWKMNTTDSKHLLASYDTVSAYASSTGFEINGIGDILRRGTNPTFARDPLAVADTTQPVWVLTPASEIRRPSDFLLSPNSPACGSAIDIPAHPVLGILPDSQTARDIGALPCGASAAEYDKFPFNIVLSGGASQGSAGRFFE